MKVANLVVERVENGYVVNAVTVKRPFIFLAPSEKDVLKKIKEMLPMLATPPSQEPTAAPPPPPPAVHQEEELPEFSDEDL